MFSFHPHGIMACGWFNWLGRHELPSQTDPEDKGFSSGFRALDGIRTKLCFAPAVQHYQLHGEMYRDMVTDAAGKTLRKIFRDTKGQPKPTTVGLCPGGFSEAVYTGYSDKYDVAFLKGRFGFIKIAIEAGVDIIVAYSFGVADMYKSLDWNRQARAEKSQATGLPMVLWSGKYGTNVPHFEDTVTVTFDPFPTSQYTLDQVEQAHEDYCQYLKVCFDTYKGCCEKSKNKELLFAGRGSPPASLSVAQSSS